MLCFGMFMLHVSSAGLFQLLLVHFGADITAVDNEGNTPLHLCGKNGHEDVGPWLCLVLQQIKKDHAHRCFTSQLI